LSGAVQEYLGSEIVRGSLLLGQEANLRNHGSCGADIVSIKLNGDFEVLILSAQQLRAGRAISQEILHDNLRPGELIPPEKSN